MNTELFVAALVVITPNVALLLFMVLVDHNRRQQEKRSAEVRAEMAAGRVQRREALRVIGGNR